jgi:hypothetical protein
MSRKYSMDSVDSTDTIGSRSYSTDENSIKHTIKMSKTKKYTIQPTNKSTKIKLKRRKREQNLPELSMSPPNKVEYYKQLLLIFKNK